MRLLNRTARRVLATAVAAACVGGAVGGVSLATAGGTGGDATMTLNEIDTNGVFVNIRHVRGGAPGDEFIFRSTLKNTSGRRVGSVDAKCTLVFGGHVQCEGTVTLPGGTLAVSALIDERDSTPDHIAITGGTGRYDRARGQVISTSTGPNSSRDVFDIDS